MNSQQTSSHIIQHWDELSRDSVLNREQLIRQMIQDCVDEAVKSGYDRSYLDGYEDASKYYRP